MLLLCACLLSASACATHPVRDAGPESPRAKNIVFMVGDGMGLADVVAARIYKNGMNGSPLHLELNHVGTMRTYSADSLVTDSAAAASAWACGEKFNNGEICEHSGTGSHKSSILEIAMKRGKSVGLVATSTITHATPAAFGAHVAKRDCEKEIARQYISQTEIDVLLGGGRAHFESTHPDKCGTSGDFITEARGKGYTVVYTKGEMEAGVAGRPLKMLGLFALKDMDPQKERAPDTTEPSLPEMTRAALSILGTDPEGFFLMVESSQIDWANHNNDLDYQISETLALDESLKVVLDWIAGDPARGSETLLVVTGDHETGGFAITGPKDTVVVAGKRVDGGWATREHTAGDVIIWSQGPGSDMLCRPGIENNSVYDVMVDVLR